jgi:O-antigen/teichoic acid export membrane protein
MVLASGGSALAGIVQSFWIPKLLSVSDFGFWRAFILYTGYAGMLHLGLVDGALLRWSVPGQKPGRSLLQRAAAVLTGEHFLLILLGAALCMLPLAHEEHRGFILVCLLIYALLFNLVGLLQVFFQSRGNFSFVAIGVSAAPLLFVLLLPALVHGGLTLHKVIAGFLLAWAVILISGVALASRVKQSGDEFGEGIGPSAYLAAGWPILLANLGYGVMQSADRVTVNLTQPIERFAVYSLSQSIIYVPITLIAAISRVAFSHFAKADMESRPRLYGKVASLLTAVWALLVPYFFGVEWVIRRFLPKYVGGLVPGSILLLSVLFLSLIQITQLPAYSLSGQQRRFFGSAVVAAAVAFATAWIGSVIFGTLEAVAWSQVLTAAAWWAANYALLSRRSGAGYRGLMRIASVFSLSTIVFLAVSRLAVGIAGRSLLYLILVLPLTFLVLRKDLDLSVAEHSRRSS